MEGEEWKIESDQPRQELRLEPRGKALKDEDSLASLGVKTGALIYFKAGTIY